MPYYLYQVAYTSESMATQVQNPQDVRERATPLIEGLGGRLVGIWYAFGEYDIVAIIEAPDNESMAAVAIAVTAGGPIKVAKTTPLMTVEEGIGAIKNAAGAGYQPPSS